MLVKMNFSLKKVFVKKKNCQKILVNNSGQKNFCSKKKLVPKKISSKKFLVQKIFWSENFLSTQMLA